MANPPKQKGTAFERKIERRLEQAGFVVRNRKVAGQLHDMEVDPYLPALHGQSPEPIRALVTEPGRGRPLVTLGMEDFMYLLAVAQTPARIECKKRGGPLWHHTIYKEKFS